MDKNVLDNLLAKLQGSTFAGLDSVVDVKLTGGQKNPQQGRVQKRHTGAVVQLFARGGEGGAYENAVNRRLKKEGSDTSFKVSPRAWGERIEGTPYVTHKGEFYLEVIFIRPGATEYLLDGDVVDESVIEGLPAKREPTGQGGLVDQVQIRTYKMSSITAIRAFGEEERA